MTPIVKVMGKGNKERLIPIGKHAQRLLWRYLNDFRQEPLSPRCENVFLTTDGWPMTGKHIRSRMALYGRRAGLQGVRCSPHTLRQKGSRVETYQVYTACQNAVTIYELSMQAGVVNEDFFTGFQDKVSRELRLMEAEEAEAKLLTRRIEELYRELHP